MIQHEVLVGHINFSDHTEPSMRSAHILKIGKRFMADADKAEAAGEAAMDNEYQGYIIPALYEGNITYSEPLAQQVREEYADMLDTLPRTCIDKYNGIAVTFRNELNGKPLVMGLNDESASAIVGFLSNNYTLTLK